MEHGKYLIGEVSEITGASPKSIRNWERYIGDVDRIYCGKMSYRFYTERQLQLIKRIKKYVNEGFRLAFAAQKALQALSS
jgi:DNA-binding transcriptional MerR regulator